LSDTQDLTVAAAGRHPVTIAHGSSVKENGLELDSCLYAGLKFQRVSALTSSICRESQDTEKKGPGFNPGLEKADQSGQMLKVSATLNRFCN